MKKTFALLLTAAALSLAALTSAKACDHSWETASDGSRCGGRAADMRPGGR